MNETSKCVAVYCRISNDPRRLEVGVERQRADCVALAQRLWPSAAVRVFVDNDLSAADPSVQRPQWQALLDALRGGEVDELVAYDQSRLTRQPLEWEQLLVVLGRRRIASLHTVREGERDVGDGTSRMVSRIVAAVDAEYVEVNRIRMKRAMRQLAAEGRPNGGRVFGYLPTIGDDGRKTRVIAEEEAAIIRWAASRVLAGETLSALARALDAQGVTHARKGRVWHSTHIRNMVTNPAVAGLRPDPDGRLIPAVWNPILEESIWLRVRATLAQPRTLVRSNGTSYPVRSAHHRPARRHLLSAGIASCGVCGAPLSAQAKRRANGELFTNYICNPRRGGVCVGIVAHRLEPFVVGALFARLGDETVSGLLMGPDDAEAHRMARALEEVDVELVDLARARGQGEISRAEWSAAREGFALRAEELREALSRLAIADIGKLRDLPQRWPSLGLRAQRAILAAVFDRIEVHRLRTRGDDSSRVKLHWRGQTAISGPADVA